MNNLSQERKQTKIDLKEQTELKVKESIASFGYYVKELGIKKAVPTILESSCLVQVENYVLEYAANHWHEFISSQNGGVWNIQCWFDRMGWDDKTCEKIRLKYLNALQKPEANYILKHYIRHQCRVGNCSGGHETGLLEIPSAVFMQATVMIMDRIKEYTYPPQ